MNVSPFVDLDIVVPRSCIHAMYKLIKDVASDYGMNYTALGHIGNGNFHVNILQRGWDGLPSWEESVQQMTGRIFDGAIGLNGTISGEHGVGKQHLHYLSKAIPAAGLDLMSKIRRVIDPNGIF
jgi:FAD/FMN-containing dehydrogenase